MKNLINLSVDGFKEFANEANTRSTLSSMDGLKPVHRRILYGMKEMKATNYKGSAQVIGYILGNYHPHGDAAVYDAAIRMSQDWKMRYPLTSLDGNGGSITNDSYAAMRYTKIKLTPLGEYMLKGIEKNTVPMVENYNGESEEPVYLPSKFPNLLCNGGLGIGVGLSSNLVPHNLNEVATAIIAMIDNPLITTEQLLEIIKGPDFPTGGVILDSEKLKDIYNFGKGTIRLRARYHLEQIEGRTHIVFTEIPYLVNIETKIIDAIKKLVVEENYDKIYDLQNCTSDKVEIRVILEKKANVNSVLKVLFEKTGLEATIKINQCVNTGKGFDTVGLQSLLNLHISNQHKLLINAAKFDLDKYEKRKEVLDGLVIAIANIEDVVQIIKSSKNREEAGKELNKKYGFSEIQVKAILDMRLSKLTNLEIDELKIEINDLITKIEECKLIISDVKHRREIIKKEIKEIAEKYGDSRKTTIAMETFNQTEDKEVFVVLKEKGLECIPITSIKVANKGARGNKLTKDPILSIIKAKQSDTIYCLTSEGNVYPIPVNQIVFNEEKEGDLTSLEEICDFEGTPSKLITFDFTKDYLVTVTKNGIMKKTNINEYKEFKKKGTLCKVKEKDVLIDAFSANEEDFIIILGSNEKLIKLPVKLIKTSAKNTLGAKSIAADTVLSCSLANNKDTIILWSDDKGKQVLVSEIPESVLKSSGVLCGEGIKGVCTVINPFVLVLTEDGKSVIYNLEDFNIKSLKSQGVNITKTVIKKLTA